MALFYLFYSWGDFIIFCFNIFDFSKWYLNVIIPNRNQLKYSKSNPTEDLNRNITAIQYVFFKFVNTNSMQSYKYNGKELDTKKDLDKARNILNIGNTTKKEIKK